MRDKTSNLAVEPSLESNQHAHLSSLIQSAVGMNKALKGFSCAMNIQLKLVHQSEPRVDINPQYIVF